MRKTGIAYLTMLCCYVYYVDDSKKQNNDDVQHIQTYAYSPEGYVKSVSLSGGKNLTTERDNLGRVKSKTVSTTTPVTDSYTYKSSSKSGYTTGLVHRHTNALGSYIYSYDDDGNITEIESSDGTLLYTYEYDELGQLIEECSRPEQKCITYTYDLNGNITTKIEYPVEISLKDHIFKVETPTRTYTYSYNNDLWKDELTSYTRVIHDSSGDRTYTTPANTYDAIGNPTKYFGSDLEWDYGRQRQVDGIVAAKAKGVKFARPMLPLTNNFL